MPDNTKLCPLTEDVCYKEECAFMLEGTCAICWIAINLARM